MKVKKAVYLSKKQIVEALRKIPGLSRVDNFVVRSGLTGSLKNDIVFEATWTDDEVIDGVYEEKK